jgi:Family of unknown function (DUF6445)
MSAEGEMSAEGMFNPAPRIEVISIADRPACFVIDDALLEPERWVEYALAHAAEFVDAPHNAYPGPELRMPEDISSRLDHFFTTHLRRHFRARRTLRMYSRLSLTTRPPTQLDPRQWLCHIDRLEMEAGQGIAACVLYLFRDEALGGTGFYRPLRPMGEIGQLVQDSSRMSKDEFTARHCVHAGYMTQSNSHFEKLLAIPPRWNRLIFYPGTIFHSADITAPERLSTDPRTGRLTLNGFFLYRRNLI